jgi:hypothetical protein
MTLTSIERDPRVLPVKRGMRIYAFAEYYLDPFKPYFDTQFTHWVSEGHELRVFAFGS